MTSEDPHAITSAPASRRSCPATFAVADRHRRALPAMAGYRVGDAVRVQACGRFRPARIVRATAVTPRIVSLGSHRSVLQCGAALDPAQPLARRRRAAPAHPDVQFRYRAALPSVIGRPLHFIGPHPAAQLSTPVAARPQNQSECDLFPKCYTVVTESFDDLPSYRVISVA